MKRLILLVALVTAMAVLAPAAFADELDVDRDDSESVEKELSEPQQQRKARMIADYFTEFYALDDEGRITEDDVVSLRTGETLGRSVGWGVVYQLYLFGFNPEDPQAYEGGWAIGQLRKTYLNNLDNDPDDLHKNNLGQAKKDAKDKPDKPVKSMPPGLAKKDKNKG